MFSVNNLTVGYGEKIVVKNASFKMEKGEFCVLLGLNGSGKTTLLKAACGLIKPASGHLMLDGVDCTNLNERKRARYISYIAQRHSELRGVSVLDTVLMGFNPQLRLLMHPNIVQKALAKDTLEKMGLKDIIEEDFSHLSEGQKQLVLLCRILVQDTPVLFMDEPDSALDFLNKHKMLAKIRNVIQTEGKMGLMTLHDPNLALAYCDKMILLHEGEIIKRLRIKEASGMDIQNCLSAIYGDIEIIEHNGRFIMI